MNSRPSFAILFLIAMCLAASNHANAKDFPISEYGAVADGKTVNTKAIQALIDKVAAEGGGTVVVPAGTFLSGSIFFKQGVNLHVAKDGVLKGTTNMDDYKLVQTRWEGVERQWVAALVNFFDMTNVTFDGEGMVDGSGDTWFGGGRRGGRGGPGTQPSSQPGQFGRGGGFGRGAATQPFARGRGAASQPNGLPGYGRPRLIAFQNCSNIKVSGLHFKDQASWCLFILYSHDVQIDHLNIRTTVHIPSSDGIDIDSSNHVKIQFCDIACNDDNIAIKCGKDDDGRRVNRPTEDVTISDCILGIGEGVAMGSEVTGSIRRITIERCKLTETGEGARFKSQPTRGGVVEDIVYRDIELNNVARAFNFNMTWNSGGRAAPDGIAPTLVRNVRLINFHGTAQSGGAISGLAANPVQNVTFENCDVTVNRGMTISNAQNIDTRGLTLHVPDGVEPIVFRNATTKPAQ